ncbi:hypothetical protein HYY74_02845 [Candidatus Woesearchaeota archaeon]|nr:hypothetical protein [Candidatus Woesearchaeota archaeon]
MSELELAISIDFRPGVTEQEALSVVRGAGLTVIQNYYQEGDRAILAMAQTHQTVEPAINAIIQSGKASSLWSPIGYQWYGKNMDLPPNLAGGVA